MNEIKEKIIIPQKDYPTRPTGKIKLRPSGLDLLPQVSHLIKTEHDNLQITGSQTGLIKGMGWIPEWYDIRDHHVGTNQISANQKRRGVTRSVKDLLSKINVNSADASFPVKVDLRGWFSPIEDQENLGSCTANAGVGLLEYFERRAFGHHLDASRLFLYKATRQLLHWTGDTGAFIRTTMGAMATFGVPPEEHWPYNIYYFDFEPPTYCYAFAQNYQALQYFRLDRPDISQPDLLTLIKKCVAAGIPPMFGFTVYESIYQAQNSGEIPMPEGNEQILGGHAVAIAGYDDNMLIQNSASGSAKTKGAFIIRNSWGTSFGDNGYCYLPYDYVLTGLADDFWSLLKAEWIEQDNFGI